MMQMHHFCGTGVWGGGSGDLVATAVSGALAGGSGAFAGDSAPTAPLQQSVGFADRHLVPVGPHSQGSDAVKGMILLCR